MLDCWNENPDKRPTFKEIYDILHLKLMNVLLKEENNLEKQEFTEESSFLSNNIQKFYTIKKDSYLFKEN